MPIWKTNLLICDIECDNCHHFFKQEFDLGEIDRSEGAKIPLSYFCPECGQVSQAIVK